MASGDQMKLQVTRQKMSLAGFFSAILVGFIVLPARAFDWSDTALSWRYGTNFAEPYNSHDISKHIFALTHADGYRYGTNYLNIDYLVSDDKNPARGSTTSGAQETYVLYRHTLDIGRVLDRSLAFGPVRGVGFTAGFDWNTKNDSYGSEKHLLVLGPTLMFDVPGFLNVSLLARDESNHPNAIKSRYTYDTNLMLSAAWKLPFQAGPLPVTFEGYANYIGAKGRNEFGGGTAPETNIDMELMTDAGTYLGISKNTFRLGLEYQFWKNKFGNLSNVPGSEARTPMIRAEYHF